MDNGYGFVRGTVEDEDYVFGSSQIDREVLQPDGQWDGFLPEYEPQFNRNFDTYGCTIFGTLNALEILMLHRFGVRADYSERYIYNLVPVRPPGGSPQSVAECIRKSGLINQELLPMTDTLDEYSTPVPVGQEYLDLGRKWLDAYDLAHDYLWRSAPDKRKRDEILKEALRYSPVGVSVSAWMPLADGTYEDGGRPNNHWCVCVGYDTDGPLTYFHVFDSYDHEVKRLSAFHAIEMAKSYYVTPAKIQSKDEKKSLWKAFLAWIKGVQLSHA